MIIVHYETTDEPKAEEGASPTKQREEHISVRLYAVSNLHPVGREVIIIPRLLPIISPARYGISDITRAIISSALIRVIVKLMGEKQSTK